MKYIKYLVEELFHKISVDEPNEEDVVRIINNPENKSVIKKVINTIPDKRMQESMLMWAVWRLKKNIVIELIKFGADCKYQNGALESVSTYWNLKPNDDKQILAGEIAEILHKNGANLGDGGLYTWSLVRKAKKYNLYELIPKLQELGYLPGINLALVT